MEELNLFALYIDILSKHQIPYFVTGSVASIVYGDPRLTHDIDLVINLNNVNVDIFLQAFQSDQFYCPPEEVIRTEMNRSARSHFNLIHHETGFWHSHPYGKSRYLSCGQLRIAALGNAE